MCLNCGCGEPETRHKETDITADDVRKAAAGTPLQKTVQNIRTSLDKMDSGEGQMASAGSSSDRSSGQSDYGR